MRRMIAKDPRRKDSISRILNVRSSPKKVVNENTRSLWDLEGTEGYDSEEDDEPPSSSSCVFALLTKHLFRFKTFGGTTLALFQ